MKHLLPYLLVFALCLLAYIYSERIAKVFTRFYARYPIVHLSPSSQHQARGFFVRIGAVLLAALVAVIAALQIMEN